MTIIIIMCRMVVMLKKTIALLAATATLFSLSGCGDASDDSASTNEKAALSVAVSFYPLAFLAQRIGGEWVNVETITPSDVEPHEYELSPAEVASLAKQDLVVYVSGFQPSLDEAVTELALDKNHALDLADTVNLLAYDTDEHAESHEHGDTENHESEHEHGKTDGHDADESDADSHAGHDHGLYDPHFWLDPIRMDNAAGIVAAYFSLRDSAHEADYKANAAALTVELEKLQNDYESALLKSDLAEGAVSTCESNLLVTPHAAFGYLGDNFDLEPLAISADAEAEPSPARIAELATHIREAGTPTVFAEARASTSSIEALAAEAGAQVSELDPIELKPAEGDYLTAMRANLAAITEGLHCGASQ